MVGMQWPRCNIATLERERYWCNDYGLPPPNISRAAVLLLLGGALDAKIATPFGLDNDLPGFGGDYKAQAHRRREIRASGRNPRFRGSFLALIPVTDCQFVQLAARDLA